MASRPLITCSLLMTLGGIACEPPSPPTVAVTDSAGVSIVLNVEGSVEAAAQWTLATEPTIDIGGGTQPDVPLYRIAAVTPLESGRVAVGTTVPSQVLVFDRAGALHATLGREGEGPGEFFIVGSVVELTADSIAVWDADRRRVSVFDEQGSLLGEADFTAVAPVSARTSGSTEAASGFTHLLPSLPGSVITFGEAGLGPSAEAAITRREMPARRVSTTGELLAAYGMFPGLATSPGMPTPFGARTHAASSGDVLVVGTSETPEYRKYASTGELTQITRWPDRDRTVDGEFLATWTALVEEQAELRDFIMSSPRPEQHPAYDDILMARDGTIFVADYPGPLGIMSLRRADPAPEAFKPTLRMPARRWLIFDAAGTLSATMDTPEGFEPYALHDEMLWGVYTDELDVESVRAYQLTRG